MSDSKDYKLAETADVEAQGPTPSLTLWGGTALVIGSMIGTGVFATGGSILKLVGSPGMAMLMWIIGTIAAYFGGMTYAEWGLMIPESGGDTPYLEYVFRTPAKLAPFMYCWARVIVVFPGYCAALSVFVGQMTLNIAGVQIEGNPAAQWYMRIVAIVTLASIWALTAFSNAIATRTTSIVTLLKVIIVAFLIVSGLLAAAGAFPSVSNPGNFSNMFAGSATSPGDYTAALSLAFFSFDGWAYLGSSIGELENPRRNVPRAIIGGVTVVAVCYLLTNIAFFLVLPSQAIKDAGENLAIEFASVLYGDFFANKIFSFFVLLSGYGCCLALTFVGSRVAIEAGKRGFLPMSERISQLHPRFNTPFNALCFHIIISILMVLPPNESVYTFLVKMCTYGVWYFYTLTTIGLLVMRKKEPQRERSFRTPIIAPIFIILVGVFLTVLPFTNIEQLPPAATVLGFILLGFPAWHFLVSKRQAKSV